MIIFVRVIIRVSSRDKVGWCLEVSNKYFDDFPFVKQQMVLIDKNDNDDAIFKTTTQVEEGAAPRIISKD